MTAGTMIIFPSQLVHAVNPYTGKRPHITLSWNINKNALPGSPLPVNPEQGV
jgi:predicted 2-oxoglutarate/Fe(II)-dependent dioxygenase YbiX